MKKIKNVAIYGSCISKGPFTTEYNPDYKERYKSVIDDQQHSFISTMQEKEEYDEEDILIPPDIEINPYATKCFKQDLEKSFINAIETNKVDYVVFDVHFDVTNGILLYDKNKILSKMRNLDKTPFYKKLKNIRELNIYNDSITYFNLWKESCDKFFKFMKEESPETVMVLAEVRALSIVHEKYSNIFIDNKFYRYCNLLNTFFKKFEQYIINTQDVYIIKFHDNVILDEEHPWGIHYAHYNKEYYQNFLSQMDKINQYNELKKDICFSSNYSKINTFDYKKYKEINTLRQKNDEIKDQLDAKNVELFKMRNELSMYITARIDLVNWGDHVGIELLEISDDNYSLFDTSWLDENEATGIVIESTEKYLELKIKCIGDGLLKIYLRSKDVRDKNDKRFPLFIDYKELIVNDSKIFSKNTLITHDYPHIYEKKVKHDEIITVKVTWSSFCYESEYKPAK